MGRKGISYEKKLAAVEKYLRGEGSQESFRICSGGMES
jgi:hypothetical protein